MKSFNLSGGEPAFEAVSPFQKGYEDALQVF
jgi:hypothetical protein